MTVSCNRSLLKPQDVKLRVPEKSVLVSICKNINDAYYAISQEELTKGLRTMGKTVLARLAKDSQGKALSNQL